MAGQKLFKTRLCVLYSKGHCHRQTCSFAHGDAELRRHNTSSSSSFNGRRDYRGADLREKLDRQHSPPRRSSLDRDMRDRLPSRGHSSPRSGKKSDWNHRKRQHFDGESDFSGSLRTFDGGEHQARDKKPSSPEFKNDNVDKLKQVQSEIDMFKDHKQQLEIYLEERVQETDSLNSKIKELEMQLSTEKEECKRISSKIKKFVKANIRQSRIQDELKRSQARLRRLGDQLGSDTRGAANEEDISINILSDEETLDDHLMSPQNGQHKASPSKEDVLGKRFMSPQNDRSKASPSKKRLRVHMMETDELKQGKMTSKRHSRWDAHLAQIKNHREIRAEANGISNGSDLVNEDKPMRGESNITSMPSADKNDPKSKVLGLALPNATRIAPHEADEDVGVVELDEKLDTEEIAFTRGRRGSGLDNTGLPFSLPPPPEPPVIRNAYLQCKGEDECVDVDGVDLGDELLDVDIL